MKQVLLTVVELGISQKRDITYRYTYLEYIYCHICNHDCPYACSKPCFKRGGFYQWLLNSLKGQSDSALMSEMRNRLFIFVASLQGGIEYNGQLATFHICIWQLSHGKLQHDGLRLRCCSIWALNVHLLGFNLPPRLCTSIIQRCIQRAHK